MQEFLNRIENELLRLKAEDSFRALYPPIGHDFCSNDYLGLSKHASVIKAASEYLEKDGFGSTSSRFIRGDRHIFSILESKLAQFKMTEAALLFSSGYMANIGAISSLIKKDDIVFSDAKNHASIIDGIKLSGASVSIYKHLDVD